MPCGFLLYQSPLFRHRPCIANAQNSYGLVQNVQAGAAGTNVALRPQLWYKARLKLAIVQNGGLKVTFVPAKQGLIILYKANRNFVLND